MTEIRFYHLQKTRLDQALPAMLERVIQRGQKAVVMAGSEERVEYLNHHLWTYHDRSFLPHGSQKDGFAADQPVWLTSADEAPNNAEVLFLCDGAVSQRLDGFDLCALLFDGADGQAVQAARELWKQWREAGHQLTYWQQTAKGWEEKART